VPALWAEARSRIIPEAMLRGVPVLAADVGGIPEAMMGVDYLLPVRPIPGYRHRVDEHMVPEAEVPEQDVGPWIKALSTLLADRRRYEELSALSRRRAHEYLASLSVEPFERYLGDVCSRPRKARESRPLSRGASGLERLSAERRRLLALRVRQKASATRPEDAWFPAPAAGAGARLRLFCFPYAGAGVAAFRGWNGRLPGDVQVCPARFPGRESRLGETPFRQMEPLVAALADAIAPRLDMPFAFYGHSMGAAVAFELARALRRAGKPLPSALLVSGARAPRFRLGHVPPPEPSEEDFLKELERLEGLPSEVREHPELLRVVLPALRADTALYRAYVYTEEAPLELPVFAYAGRSDPNIRAEHLEAWATETKAEFRLRWFDGGHFFIDTAREEFLAAMAADLRAVVGS
jgi:medium-chain acyl-[acyl-carrier-protein] hydrolase